MANCPNCGRSTARTKDWCCQWCGYPLFSGAFKTINKTYKELKAERLAILPAEEVIESKNAIKPEEGKVAEKVNKVEFQKSVEKKDEKSEKAFDEQPDSRIKPSSRLEPSVENKQIRKDRYDSPHPVRRRIIRRRRRAPASEPEVIEYVEYIDEPEDESEEYIEEYEESGTEEDGSEYDDEYEKEEPRVIKRPAQDIRSVRIVRPVHRTEGDHTVRQEITGKSSPVLPPEVGPVEHSEVFEDGSEEKNSGVVTKEVENPDKTIAESVNKVTGKPESGVNNSKVSDPQKNPVPVQALMEITVDELVTAYETEGQDADIRFANKLIKITGLVGKIDIKEAASVYALVLEAPGANPLRQTVRCVFGRENRDTLQHITRGQTVSIQGRYDGSIINISMRDCFLI